MEDVYGRMFHAVYCFSCVPLSGDKRVFENYSTSNNNKKKMSGMVVKYKLILVHLCE